MSGRYAFLLTGRWLGIALLVLAVSLTCVFLGRWQYSRHESKVHEADLVRTNYDAEPVALTELVPTPDATWPDDESWRPVQLRGEYLTPALTLPQRPIEGSPADHVIAVFAADVGGQTWLIVLDRGWYPTNSFTDHAAQHELPDGEVTATVRLRAAEPPTDRDLAPGLLRALHPEQVLAELARVRSDQGGGSDQSVGPDESSDQSMGPGEGSDPDQSSDLDQAELVTGAYGTLAEESPTTAAPPAPLPRPSTDLGNHLSYTFQWWVFGAGAWVAFVVMARREAADSDVAEAQAGETASGEPTTAESTGGSAVVAPGVDQRGGTGSGAGPSGAAGSAAGAGTVASDRPRPARRRRRITFADEAEEDALIDAQLAARQPSDQASDTSSR